MGDERARHIDDALSSLIDQLIPFSQDEDEALDQERHDNGVELAKSIIEGRRNATIISDVTQISDLIKKKLSYEFKSPNKAIQFSNLNARLVTKPVLSQKWAILYLLYQLADSSPGEETTLKSEVSQVEYGLSSQTNGRRSGLSHRVDDPSDINNALLSAGLHAKSSTHGSRFREDTRQAQIMSEKPEQNSSEALLANESTDHAMPTESALLRDLPFTLQGLSSTHLSFVSSSDLVLPNNLSIPLISLLHTLAEPSLLYRKLSDFVQSRDDGLISQSLRSAIGNELRSYLGLIATLEGEIRRAVPSLNTNESYAAPGKVGVTLKRCVVWTREATMGLRLMSLMEEKAKSKKGGQLISMVHTLSSSHGDPFVVAFAERMLVHVTRPFYDMLRQWIYDGELSDPFKEFFVIEQGSEDKVDREIDPRRVPATSVWEDKYKLDDAMLPTIMTEELANKVFLIGKSLNFIRYSCGDSAWVEAYCKDASKELRYGDTATLESSIDDAYKTTMARLIHLMDTKFQLFEHLRALKKYLLLGQGDFIALLMESLSSNLDRPAGSQYRHTLTAQLEHAIRGSNAQYDSKEVLRRLDARLLELSHGDIGWDVFSLEYKIDAPVDVIITQWASRKYLTIFNFLWRVKRVEFALANTWRQCITGARGVLADMEDEMNRDWKIARCCIAEMIHFVNQLQYYILFEVIEASWDQLQAAIARPDCTLDDLIEAHTKYLEAITHKGLLGQTRNIITGTREDSFTSQLHHILKNMLSYQEAVDGLYSISVAEFTRRQEISAKIETGTAHGKLALHDKDEEDKEDSRLPSPFAAIKPSATKNNKTTTRSDSPSLPPRPSILTGLPSTDDQMLPTLRTRLTTLEKDFHARVNVLLGDLATQPDADMRFLGVVMNFNAVYAPRKRKGGGQGKGERKTPGGSAVGGAPAIGGKERKDEREEKEKG